MVLKGFFKKLIMDDEFKEKLDFLKKVPIFADLGRGALSEVYGIAYEKSYSAGEVVFEENQPARALYIVKSGRVKITKRDKEIALLN